MIEGLTTTRAAAERLGLTQRRVAGLCASGEIVGAQLMGKTWLIPEQSLDVYVLLHPRKKRAEAL